MAEHEADSGYLPGRVKITVTGECGHVLWAGFDKIDEKYPFWCDECDDDRRQGKYPWSLETEIVTVPRLRERTENGRA